MRDLAQKACVAQETDEAEMIQGRAKSPAGKGETDSLHERPEQKSVLRPFREASLISNTGL